MDNYIHSQALAAISETIPAPLQPIAIQHLNGVCLKPEDFLPVSAKEDSRPKTSKGPVGRPAAAQKPFPESFPAGSGITYDNLYDSRTMKIIGGCLRRLHESRLFSEAELEDKRIELMESSPFMPQGFNPQTAVTDARYKFTSTVLGHMTSAIFNKRRVGKDLFLSTRKSTRTANSSTCLAKGLRVFVCVRQGPCPDGGAGRAGTSCQ